MDDEVKDLLKTFIVWVAMVVMVYIILRACC